MKHLWIGGIAALTLAACGGDTNGAKASSKSGDNQYELAGDHAIGNPDAAVTMVEYASVTCGHCANWHETVYPDFKKKYVDSGKVRYIFREFPTPPENLAQAGFLIANCADENKFFDNIALQFKKQKQIFAAANNGTVREQYVAIAKSAGLSEQEFESCLTNQEEIDKYTAVVQSGIDKGVAFTPSFIINGKLMDRTVFKLDSLEKEIAPILGEPISVKTDEADAEKTDN